jgi:multiple sugar transport system substrate-binding protein
VTGRSSRRGMVPPFLAAACVLLAVSAACNRGGDESAGTRVLLWQFWDPKLVAPAIDAFEAEHPGVTVEVETLTWQNGFEKILLAMAARRPPDLLELGSTWVARFAAEGALLDLTDQTASLVDSLRFWEPVTWQGRRYGMPWLLGTRAVFYNRALFRRAGLDPDRPPRTWAEFRAAARAVDALGPDIHGFGLNAGERYVLYKKFLPFAWANGGRVLTVDGKHADLDSPQNREALAFYLSLGPYSLREKQDVLDRAFQEGRLGMMISGGWNLANIPRDAPDLDFGVALMPRPAEDKGEPVSFAGGEMLAVPREAKHPREALALARELVRPERAAVVSREARSVLPAARGAAEDTTLAGDPRQRVFVEQLAWARSTPSHPRWVDMEGALDSAVEEALYGRLTPEQALARAQREIEEILSQAEEPVAQAK